MYSFIPYLTFNMKKGAFRNEHALLFYMETITTCNKIPTTPNAARTYHHHHHSPSLVAFTVNSYIKFHNLS